MSDNIGGLFSLDRKQAKVDKTGSQSSFTPLPEQRGLNTLFLNNMSALLGGPTVPPLAGGISAYLPALSDQSGNAVPYSGSRYNPSLFVPGGQEQNIINRIVQYAGHPTSNPLYSALTDKTGLVDSFKSYFDQIIGPELANNATISGYGGRGSAGYGELASRYLASVAPSIESIYRQGLEAAPGVNAQTIGNEGTALQAAGLGRQGQLQDYFSQLQTVLSASLGIPISGGGSTMSSSRTTQKGTTFGNFNDLLSSVGKIAGAVAGAG